MNRALTTYGAGQVMSLLTGGAPSMPAGTWLAGSSTDFGENGAGGTEPTQPSYARVPLTWTNTGAAINSQAPVDFPTLTEAWSPGSYVGGVYTPIRYAGVFDAASGGNCIMRFDVGHGGADLPAANVSEHISFSGGFGVSPALNVGDSIITMRASFALSLLGHVLGVASYTVPTLSLALLTTAANDLSSYAEPPSLFNYASGYSRQAVGAGFGSAAVIGAGTYAGTIHDDFTSTYSFGPFHATNPAFGIGASLPSALGIFDSATTGAGTFLAHFLYPGGDGGGAILDGDTVDLSASFLWWWVD